MRLALCPRDAVVPGELVGVVAGALPVLLVGTADGVVAYRDRCPHLGVRLSEGSLVGHELTCRAHCWRYDVRDGAGINPAEAHLVPVAIEVEGDTIYVDVDAETRR